MKKLISLFSACAVLITALAGCSASNSVKNSANNYPVVVEGVTIQKSPKTIASLSPDITDMLINLKYGDKLVCVSSDYELPDDIKAATAGTAIEPDIDAIIKAKPEILFSTTALTNSQLQKLTKAEIKTVIIPAAKSLDGVYKAITDIYAGMEGSVSGQELSKNVTSQMKKDLEFIKNKIPEDKRLSFMYVSSSELMVSTPDTLESSLLSVFADNAIKTGTAYTPTEEEIKAAKPDIILIAPPLKEENISGSPLFSDKDAIKNQKITEVDFSKVTLYSTDIVESAREVATILYPDISFLKETSSTASSK